MFSVHYEFFNADVLHVLCACYDNFKMLNNWCVHSIDACCKDAIYCPLKLYSNWPAVDISIGLLR